jgi:hypothetical protein
MLVLITYVYRDAWFRKHKVLYRLFENKYVLEKLHRHNP